MLNRTIPPKFKKIKPIHFPWPEPSILSNKIPLYVLSMGNQPVIELEVIFKSGKYYEEQFGAAYFTACMLLEGTRYKSSQEIAHMIDYYGATISARSQADFCSISLSTLSKYLSPMLDLLMEILLHSSFSSRPLQLLKNKAVHSIQMANKKSKNIAYKQFCAFLFTKGHPYGRSLTLLDVDQITLENLHYHYEKNFFSACSAFVSGQLSSNALQNIQHALESLKSQEEKADTQTDIFSPVPQNIHIKEGQYIQSAIVIGKKMCSKSDTDFLPMVIVNELLGGYFGSRLMQTIREEKGYTYDIHSSIVSLQKATYLVISTEVAKEVTQKAIRQIYKEIEILQKELVSQEELERVKNYLLGHFLHSINDPFSIMQHFQAAYLHGLNQNYYTRFYSQVCNITAPKIRSLVQKYLSLDSFIEVIVG